jgi:hypothetical protein
MGKEHDRSNVYGLGLAAALLLFLAAGGLAKLPAREASDALYPVISKIVLGGILLIILVVVAALTYRWANKAVLITAVLLLAAAASAYPTSHADQNKPVIFSLGLLFPIGGAVGSAALLVFIFREFKRRGSAKGESEV